MNVVKDVIFEGRILDVIRSADYVIDMDPGSGETGGEIVAAGTPEEIRRRKQNGRFTSYFNQEITPFLQA